MIDNLYNLYTALYFVGKQSKKKYCKRLFQNNFDFFKHKTRY